MSVISRLFVDNTSGLNFLSPNISIFVNESAICDDQSHPRNVFEKQIFSQRKKNKTQEQQKETKTVLDCVFVIVADL